MMWEEASLHGCSGVCFLSSETTTGAVAVTEPSRPHVLLFADASTRATLALDSDVPVVEARWRFVVESVDGSERFEATDLETDVTGNRLQLLPVVWGLESLDAPSKVTLITPSRYVTRCLKYNLAGWRETKWCWESFGVMEPITNHDLWRRLDQTLQYHEVECRTWRLDAPEEHGVSQPHFRRIRRRRTAAEISAQGTDPVLNERRMEVSSA